MNEDKKSGLNNIKVDQLGFVYKDVEKQAKILEETYNIPKITFFEFHDQIISYHGKETTNSIKLGATQYNNVNIELIQPLGGNNLYQEFIDGGHEGLHHIGMYVDDLDSSIEDFNKKGINPLQMGQIFKMHYAYMDTQDTFGIIIELLKIIPKKRRNN
jgi:4-hydroxyphenylpyruvate dioxygenase-like putative hemolysin